MKGFSARDGMGISLVRAAGLKTALVTGRRSPMVEQRAKDLHIDYVLQDCSHKLRSMQQLCSEIGLSLDEVAYMGDDLNDVELIANAGFGAAPSMPVKKHGTRLLLCLPIPAAMGPSGSLPNIF